MFILICIYWFLFFLHFSFFYYPKYLWPFSIVCANTKEWTELGKSKSFIIELIFCLYLKWNLCCAVKRAHIELCNLIVYKISIGPNPMPQISPINSNWVFWMCTIVKMFTSARMCENDGGYEIHSRCAICWVVHNTYVTFSVHFGSLLLAFQRERKKRVSERENGFYSALESVVRCQRTKINQNQPNESEAAVARPISLFELGKRSKTVDG